MYKMTTEGTPFPQIKPFDSSGFSNWEFLVKLLSEQSTVLSVISGNGPVQGDKRNRKKYIKHTEF